MKKIFRDRKRIALYVDGAEYAWLESQAGGNISRWCREKIFNGAEPRRAESGTRLRSDGDKTPPATMPRQPTQNVHSAEMPTAPTKSKKVCVHGTAKGIRCWQCGGLAKIGEPK